MKKAMRSAFGLSRPDGSGMSSSRVVMYTIIFSFVFFALIDSFKLWGATVNAEVWGIYAVSIPTVVGIALAKNGFQGVLGDDDDK